LKLIDSVDLIISHHDQISATLPVIHPVSKEILYSFNKWQKRESILHPVYLVSSSSSHYKERVFSNPKKEHDKLQILRPKAVRFILLTLKKQMPTNGVMV
jgi:hypothetical protein